MTDSYPCPACGRAANLTVGCASCGRPPDPVAAEVIRLDGEIRQRAGVAEAARVAYADAMRELTAVQTRRNALAAQVMRATRTARPARQAPVAAPVSGSVAPPATPPPAPTPPPASPPGEFAKGGTAVQTVLFILGGLLLGTAAIVFTAVAWATFGVGGRAAILATVTGLALAAPVLALRRRLAGTAETFAAVGMLLVLLDGYAAWSVNLAGLADRASPERFAAGVCAVAALVASVYAGSTGLAGPRFAAVLLAQPVLPLAMVDSDPSAAGWAAVFLAVAAADLALVGRHGAPLRGVRLAHRVVTWICLVGALGVGVAFALAAQVFVDTPAAALRAGLALLGVAAMLVGVGVRSGDRALREVTAGTAVLAVALAAVRYVSVAWPDRLLPAAAVVGLVLALLIRLITVDGRRGAGVGAGIAVGIVALVGAGQAAWVGALTVASGYPIWHADLDRYAARVSVTDAGLPATLLLVCAGALAVLPRRGWWAAAVPTVALVALALPGSLPLAWWSPSIVDLLAAVPLLLFAVRGGRWSAACGVTGGMLVAHAVLAGLARPSSTALVLWVVVLTGAVALARSVSTRPAVDTPGTVTGAAVLYVALMAVPQAVHATVVAAGGAGAVAARWGFAASVVGVGVMALLRRASGRSADRPAWLLTVTASGACEGVLYGIVLAGFGTADPVQIYAGAGLLLIVAVVSLVDRSVAAWLALSAGPAALVLAVTAGPAVWRVLAAPYAGLTTIWDGSPVAGRADVADAVALVLLVAAGTLAGLRFGRWWLSPAVLGPATALVVLSATGAGWPSVPLLSLALGVGAGLAVALRGRAGAVLVPQALLLTGAGLAGLLDTRATTLLGVGTVLVAAAVAGAAGRPGVTRTVGWSLAVAAAGAFAVTSAQAGGVRVAFPVLGAAALALAVAMLLGRSPGRRGDAVAVEAGAHALAVVAAVVPDGLRTTALVCALWGVAVGLRALWPAGSPVRRRFIAVAAAGAELVAWWLLLAAGSVRVVEPYTLPAATLALVAGVLAVRARPDLRSWVAYGPGLAAAFLPSLAAVLVTEGAPVRRLLLGAAALAVVVGGAVRRRQAPVLVGGGVLVLLALHEAVLLWDLLPRWIPLAAGGLVLVGLAVTYERRRRDLARIRASVAQMT